MFPMSYLLTIKGFFQEYCIKGEMVITRIRYRQIERERDECLNGGTETVFALVLFT